MNQPTCEPLFTFFLEWLEVANGMFLEFFRPVWPTWHFIDWCGTPRGSVDDQVVLHLKLRSVTSFVLEKNSMAPAHSLVAAWPSCQR